MEHRSRLDTLFPYLLLIAIAGPVALLWDREVVGYTLLDSQAYLSFCDQC